MLRRSSSNGPIKPAASKSKLKQPISQAAPSNLLHPKHHHPVSSSSQGLSSIFAVLRKPLKGKHKIKQLKHQKPPTSHRARPVCHYPSSSVDSEDHAGEYFVAVGPNLEMDDHKFFGSSCGGGGGAPSPSASKNKKYRNKNNTEASISQHNGGATKAHRTERPASDLGVQRVVSEEELMRMMRDAHNNNAHRSVDGEDGQKRRPKKRGPTPGTTPLCPFDCNCCF